MALSERKKKIFGVALDPSDDPASLELKRAWMLNSASLPSHPPAYRDPYTAFLGSYSALLADLHLEPAGEFTVPSWLWPRPELSDLPWVNSARIARYYDSGNFVSDLILLQSFVKSRILPALPIMLGVDHAATSAVVSALSERLGSVELSVIVLDQHFDAIPQSVRAAGLASPASPPPDHLSCGNFWASLLSSGRLLPRNLSFVGVADYPDASAAKSAGPFAAAYLEYEKAGCRFFRLTDFEGQYKPALAAFLDGAVGTPHVYVSLDLDVASYAGVLAARYMDGPGLNRSALLEAAALIRASCAKSKATLAGLDIMEFNMHFLGLEMEDGVRDLTLPLAADFLRVILS